MLQHNQDYLLTYMAFAPFALAFERSLECRIYARLPLARPILDLGCGEGLFARITFAEKIDTGVDPNPNELERARALDGYAELIQCAGDAVPKPDASYRTIFSNSVLEHIPRLEPVFREIHRLLVPGGRFYFTVPSDRFTEYTVIHQLLMALGLPQLARKYRRFYDYFWEHYHCYPEETWTTIARGFDFDVIESYTYDPKHICLLNDLLVPFSALEFLFKRMTNRWTLLPSARRIVVYPLYLLARRILQGCERTDAGGLVFVAVAKPGAKS